MTTAVGASLRRDDLYHETLPLYRRALRIREDVWEETGPYDPNRRENAYEAAESRGNMGALLMDLGRHQEAGPYLASALRILGEEVKQTHERNAGTLVLLGRALRAEGNYTLAASSLEAALAIYSNVSRTPPPAAARALANLGAAFEEWTEEDHTLSALQRARTLEAACGWLGAALNGFEQMYGEDHPSTGGALRALAGVRDAQGAAEDGRRYRERAEANRQRNVQAEEADAGTLDAHGAYLMEYGLYDEAQAYLERALGIREEIPGERHFDTSTSLLKLGVLLQLRRREAGARAYLQRALAVRVDICGENHPATELVRENLRLLGG